MQQWVYKCHMKNVDEPGCWKDFYYLDHSKTHFCGLHCDLLCTSLALWVVSPSWFSAWTPYALKSQLPQRDPRDALSVVRPSWFSACTPYALKSELPQRDLRDALSMVRPSWFSACTPYALKSQLPQRDPRDGLWVWWVQAGSQPARRTPWSWTPTHAARTVSSLWRYLRDPVTQ